MRKNPHRIIEIALSGQYLSSVVMPFATLLSDLPGDHEDLQMAEICITWGIY